MKRFTKRIALVTGLLFTALICMGIVYIDTVNNYWHFSGGFIALTVNTNAQASITVDTNTLRVGINTNNSTYGVQIVAKNPTNSGTASGTDSSTVGEIQLRAAAGGNSTNPASGAGGTGGQIEILAGPGGAAATAVTNSTGGTGGAITITAGVGGNELGSGAATNNVIGGNGGGITVTAGAGGRPIIAGTNTAGGSGGAFSFASGAGGSSFSGWSRRGGAGGGFTMSAGSGAASTRTNGGGGGNFTINAGNAGQNTTAPGDAGSAGIVSLAAGNGGSAAGAGNPTPGGYVVLTGGDGKNGATNANGGNIYLVGGNPGTGARDGDVIVGVPPPGTGGGSTRGGLMIGPTLASSVSLTNLLGGSATLDFPSTTLGAVADLPIAVTGVTSNGCVAMIGVPWEASQVAGSFSHFLSNDAVFIRFTPTAATQDPTPGVFSAVVFKVK